MELDPDNSLYKFDQGEELGGWNLGYCILISISSQEDNWSIPNQSQLVDRL